MRRMRTVNNSLFPCMHIYRRYIGKGRDSSQAVTAVYCVSCVSLHVSTSSLKLPPTLIYSAPDLLLFCHPDMFNKYCLARAGYTMVSQRCCCLSAQKVMDYV